MWGCAVGLCLFLIADFLWFLVPPPPCGCVDGSRSPRPLWMWGCGGALLVSDAAPCGCGAVLWGSACFWCCWLSLVSSAPPPVDVWMGHGPPPCGCGAVVGLCLFLMLLPVDVGLCCGALLVSDAADFLWFLVPPPPLWMCGWVMVLPPVDVGLWWGSACFWCHPLWMWAVLWGSACFWCWLSLVSSGPPPCGCVDGSRSPRPLWMWGCGGALLVSDAADFLWFLVLLPPP